MDGGGGGGGGRQNVNIATIFTSKRECVVCVRARTVYVYVGGGVGGGIGHVCY